MIEAEALRKLALIESQFNLFLFHQPNERIFHIASLCVTPSHLAIIIAHGVRFVKAFLALFPTNCAAAHNFCYNSTRGECMERRIVVRGDRVRQLRKDRNFTQGQVELQSGVDRSLISRIERGIRSNVYAQTIGSLARALKTSTDYLLGLTGNPAPPANPGLNEEESRLITLFRALHEDQRGMVLACSEWLAKRFK